MTIVINGTTGISGVDGSAGTPAIQGTDTNTGVFYPAADTVGVSTGGSERMRVDSSGNVGVGTSSPSARLHVQGGSAGSGSYNGYTKLAVEASDYSVISLKCPAANFNQIIFTDPTSSNLGGINYFNSSNATPNAMAFLTNATERMRIDSSGNVGIGTSSPNYKLQVKATTNQNFGISGAVSLTYAVALSAVNDANSANVPIEMRYATNFAWFDAGTERMRIDSSGNVGIGAASPTSTTKFYVEQSTGNVLGYFNSTAASQNARVRINSTDTASSVAYVWSYSNASLNKQASIYLTSAGALATQVGQTAGAEPTTGTTAMFIDSSGNVGIGTTNPSRSKLVIGATTPQISFTDTDGTSNIVDITRVSGPGVSFSINGGEKMRIDTVGNMQMQAGAVMPYAPAPASISTTATLTNANIQAQIINTTGTTYTVTMPLGTTLETLATWATTNIGYDFFVINTASGTITMAVNTGVTSLGTLTIATGVSAQFRIRRTAANTFVLYRLG